jgi:integrase
MATKRRDKNRIVLKTGESYRESDKRYVYRWTDRIGGRHSVYAKTLDELREKEKEIAKDVSDGMLVTSHSVTVNDIYYLWRDTKRGIKDTTFQTYCYLYETVVSPVFGKKLVSNIKKTDMKRFYNSLADLKGLQANSIYGIHSVVHQVFDIAVDDGYIRVNPSDNALKELKKSKAFLTEKKTALTVEQERLLLQYLRSHPQYKHWYPIIAVMVGSGLRVGEVTGLRWDDIDLDEGIIDVNHTLVYYAHRLVRDGEKTGSYFAINSTKTVASKRQIPMLGYVREAFEMERQFQQETGVTCRVSVDGYSNFIFVNRFGGVQQQGTINRGIYRVTRDCNAEQVEKGLDILLPHFSCHTLRHTFATRMCENGVNLKVIQDVMGHTDISTTLNIYTDATKEMKSKAFEEFDTMRRQSDTK